MNDNLPKIEELCRRAFNRSDTLYSRFLNLSEQKDAVIAARKANVYYKLWGGAEDAERQVFGVCSFDEPDLTDFPITCLLASPKSIRFSNSFTHRDVLGSLMSLGIKREETGDIIVREEGAYIFCLSQMADFISGALDQISGTQVTCAPVDPPAGPLRKVTPVRLQVMTPRIDAVVAHLFKLSRSDSQELFRQGKIMVDDAPCPRPDTFLKEGQIISVRGYGRARYDGIEGMSKKGKTNLIVSLYS